MYKIVIVEKMAPYNSNCSYLQRRNRIAGRSVQQIIDQYQGFEGDAVSFHSCLNNMDYQESITQFEEFNCLNPCSFLHVLTEEEFIPNFVKKTATRVGFDIGICSEECFYSSIAHEVLFGMIPELIASKDFLNENLFIQD